MLTYLLVIAPTALVGAKVESVKGGDYLLDRTHPRDGSPIRVAPDEVVVQHFPECCYAPETASLPERQYAAYNMGWRSRDRAGIAHNGEPCPTWAQLIQRSAEGDVAAKAVVDKWHAVAECTDRLGEFGTFGWALRQLRQGHAVRRKAWTLRLTVEMVHAKSIIDEDGPKLVIRRTEGTGNHIFGAVEASKAETITIPYNPYATDLFATDWVYAEDATAPQGVAAAGEAA